MQHTFGFSVHRALGFTTADPEKAALLTLLESHN